MHNTCSHIVCDREVAASKKSCVQGLTPVSIYLLDAGMQDHLRCRRTDADMVTHRDLGLCGNGPAPRTTLLLREWLTGGFGVRERMIATGCSSFCSTGDHYVRLYPADTVQH